MAVVPRTSDAERTEITSPNVGTKTVVGMVLGIMCLFTMILSYQLIARPRKNRREASRRVPRSGSVAFKSTHTPSNTTRSFLACFDLSGKINPANHGPHSSEKSSPSQDPRHGGRKTLRALLLPFTLHDASGESDTLALPSAVTASPTLRERKGLRALRLNTNALNSPTRRYPSTPSPMTPMRKRVGRIFEFHFDSSAPCTPASPTSLSPITPFSRRHYAKLDDSFYSEDPNSEAAYPPEAVLSPWSPDEGKYPYAPYSPLSVKSLSDGSSPRSPPPLYPPPPAYLREVPMRSDGLVGSAPATPTRPSRGSAATATFVPTPVSPIASSMMEELDGEIGRWDVSDVRAVLARTVTVTTGVDRPAGDDVFVISDGSDEDDCSQELDAVSLHTDESMQPLRL